MKTSRAFSSSENVLRRSPMFTFLCVFGAAEGSGEDGVLPRADLCFLLAAAPPQPPSEENHLRRKRPQPLRAAQVGKQISASTPKESLMRIHCSPLLGLPGVFTVSSALFLLPSASFW